MTRCRSHHAAWRAVEGRVSLSLHELAETQRFLDRPHEIALCFRKLISEKADTPFQPRPELRDELEHLVAAGSVGGQAVARPPIVTVGSIAFESAAQRSGRAAKRLTASTTMRADHDTDDLNGGRIPVQVKDAKDMCRGYVQTPG